jgi:energy-coupling factor transporter ATP-binding protein EcfA2
VRHHLEVAASLGGCLLDDGALEALLTRVGLRHRMADRMVELSVGQRRRVGLLAAVLPGLVDGGGRLLVLDEPTAGLDQDGIELASELVNEAAARGCTVLLGTHHPERFACATHSVTVDEGGLRVVDLPGPEVRAPSLTSLAPSVVRPSTLRLGLRYAWSGGTPLSGSVPALLVTLGCAALLLQPTLVSAFDGTLRLGLLLLPALVVGLAGDASLTTLRRDRAYARLSALGCRPLDPLTPLALGCAGTVAMGAILGASPSFLDVVVAGGVSVSVSMLVRAGDVLGLRLARPEVLHLRLLSLLVVLPFGLLLDLMA